jgi:hypothetical protein
MRALLGGPNISIICGINTDNTVKNIGTLRELLRRRLQQGFQGGLQSRGTMVLAGSARGNQAEPKLAWD